MTSQGDKQKKVDKNIYPDTKWFIKHGMWVCNSHIGTMFFTVKVPQKFYETTLPFNKWLKMPLTEKAKWCKTIKGLLKNKL